MNSRDFVCFSPCGPVSGSIRPPGSKSITNRALICAALASGRSTLDGVLDSDDTQVMMQAWKKLGLHVVHDPATQSLEIEGCQGHCPNSEAEIFVGNSGTTIRFLTAALSACRGKFTLDGVDRMRERPIGDLIEALEQLGAKITRLNSSLPECPPLRVDAQGLAGGRAQVQGNISSQYLSGLMMAAPLAAQRVRLEVQGELVSVPYVRMTAAVMRAFGAEVHLDLPRIEVDTQHGYRGVQYSVEPDASAASYYWAAAAITGGEATVLGLSRESLQGDVGFCEVLRQMGCGVEYREDSVRVTGVKELRGVDVDMADISDTVQTLAAVSLFAKGATNVRGVAHNRVKETDRIGDLATELRKFGATVEERADGLKIIPPPRVEPATIETYDDHRMAMSLSLVGLRVADVEILNPGCTAKTYPSYWEEMSAFCRCTVRRN